MFEEVIGNEEINEIEMESQRAAKQLLKSLKKAENIVTRDDKKLIREHIERKFA